MEHNPFLEQQTIKAIELIRKKNYSALRYLFIDTAFINNEDYKNELLGSDKAEKWTLKYCKEKFLLSDTDEEIRKKFNIAIFRIQAELSTIDL